MCLCVSMCMRDNKKGVGSVGVFWGLNRERERERRVRGRGRCRSKGKCECVS